MEDPAFDEDWYCRRYPDVGQAVAQGHFRNAGDHYRQFGLDEGRQTHPQEPLIVIHIGPPKTATTYLQANLALARDHLADQGIAYPIRWSGKDGSDSHETFFEQLVTGQATEITSEISRLIDQGYSKIIVSSENLCLLHASYIETLSNILLSHPVKIVYYLRPWPDRLMSLWKESMRHGGTETFLTFFSRHLASPRSSDVINSYKHLKLYARAFGPKNLILVSHECVISNGLDLFDHFVEKVVGAKRFSTPLTGTHVHRSASLFDTEIARVLNALSAPSSPDRERIGLYFLDNLHRFETGSIWKVMNEHRAVIRLDDRAREFSTFYRKTYQRFAPNMIDPRPREYLFENGGKEYAYVSPDYLLNARVRDEIGQIHTEIGSILAGDKVVAN